MANPAPTILPANPSPTPRPTEIPEAVSGSSEPAAHVLAAAFPEPAPAVNDVADGEPNHTVILGDGGSGGRISRVAFRKSFFGTFKGGARFTGLRSLAIPDDLREEGEDAADALYDTACDVSWLNWMVQPGNVWLQRGFAMFAFGAAMGQGVSAEIAERKLQAKRDPAAKPDEAPAPIAEGDTASSGTAHQDMTALGTVPGEKEATAHG